MERDSALDYLLSLHGETVYRDDGYWWKVEAWEVKPTSSIPHGIRYNLTLHDRHNTRVFGMDNAHGIKPPKKGKFTGASSMTISIGIPAIKDIRMSSFLRRSYLRISLSR